MGLFLYSRCPTKTIKIFGGSLMTLLELFIIAVGLSLLV
jgi:hypothetical protein